MIERIKENEEKLDKVISTIKELDNALNNFEKIQNIVKELNEYYGSHNWFKDKEHYENGKIENVKAGVLNEDAVWNVNENIRELAERMNEIWNKIIQKNNDTI